MRCIFYLSSAFTDITCCSVLKFAFTAAIWTFNFSVKSQYAFLCFRRYLIDSKAHLLHNKTELLISRSKFHTFLNYKQCGSRSFSKPLSFLMNELFKLFPRRCNPKEERGWFWRLKKLDIFYKKIIVIRYSLKNFLYNLNKLW